MEPSKVNDEDDLLAFLMQKYRLGEFAKVNSISTLKISPDIDLLYVNEYYRIVTGYEFKLLKYNKHWKRVDFTPMYTGLGQALQYFQFGVDKSYLVLGISEEIPTDLVSLTEKKIEEMVKVFASSREIRKTEDWILQLSGISKKDFFGFDCFGIKLWNGHQDLLSIKLSADANYPVGLFKDLEHKKNCLLRKEFKWDKRFLEKHRELVNRTN